MVTEKLNIEQGELMKKYLKIAFLSFSLSLPLFLIGQQPMDKKSLIEIKARELECKSHQVAALLPRIPSLPGSIRKAITQKAVHIDQLKNMTGEQRNSLNLGTCTLEELVNALNSIGFEEESQYLVAKEYFRISLSMHIEALEKYKRENLKKAYTIMGYPHQFIEDQQTIEQEKPKNQTANAALLYDLVIELSERHSDLNGLVDGLLHECLKKDSNS